MTILEEAHHSLIIIEHDPILYEDSQEMVEYISQAMRQASQEASTVILAWSGPILGRPSQAGRSSVLLRRRAKRNAEADCQDAAENGGSEDFGGILMISWSKKQLAGPRMALETINLRILELEVAKEILSKLFDIRTREVDEMIRQRMGERTIYGRELSLSYDDLKKS
jgi:hypothetical protein